MYYLWKKVITVLRIKGILTYTSEKAMAPHSSTLAWKIPWVEEPGRLQSMGSRRVGHNWSDLAAAAAATYTLGFPCGSAGKESACNVGDLGLIPGLGRSPGEERLPTPIFWPGELSMGSQRVRQDWIRMTSIKIKWPKQPKLWGNGNSQVWLV